MSLHRPRASHRPAFPASCLLTFIAILFVIAPRLIAAQQADPQTVSPKNATTPTLIFSQFKPGQSLHMVAYGDMRFTDPSRTSGTNPRIRKWLAQRVALEKPQALLLTGDTPYTGARTADWQVYDQETAPWRAIHALVLPALGNHEIYGDPKRAIANYFHTYPQVQGHLYYSALLGSVEVISLDYMEAFKKMSTQNLWFANQLDHIPSQVEFILILCHSPMVADWQSQIFARLPDRGTLSLRDILEAHLPSLHAKVVVFSGHIHNYERFERNGVEYVVTGGGGAEPYPVLFRGSEDLYRDTAFPVFHYLTVDVANHQLHAVMWKVADPDAPNLAVEAKDQFTVYAQPSSAPGKH